MVSLPVNVFAYLLRFHAEPGPMRARCRCTHKEMNVDLITSFDLFNPTRYAIWGLGTGRRGNKEWWAGWPRLTDNQFMTIPEVLLGLPPHGDLKLTPTGPAAHHYCLAPIEVIHWWESPVIATEGETCFRILWNNEKLLTVDLKSIWQGNSTQNRNTPERPRDRSTLLTAVSVIAFIFHSWPCACI